MSQLKMYTKRKIDSTKQNLEHKCILQESRDLFCLSREITAQEIATDDEAMYQHNYENEYDIRNLLLDGCQVERGKMGMGICIYCRG